MSQQPIKNNLLENVQGDILVGIPKKTQSFFFFTIDDSQITQFRTQLGQLLPLITTGAGTHNDRTRILQHKRSRARGLVDLAETNIAFSHFGLSKLGFDNDGDKIDDDVFDKGMVADIPNINDNINDWLAQFKTPIDGTILVAGSSHDSIDQGLDQMKTILGETIKAVFTIRGDARPGAESGHEHFGFADGISEPAVDGFDTSLPGQVPVIAPGIILLGREGDPIATRPEWAKDGSFLCFRMLAQRVPEFDAFLSANAIRINDPSAPAELGKELLGARMVGRWKSGAPVDLAPLQDDPALGADPQRNNNFDFSNDGDPPSRCPFAAHVRKTNPRTDLPPTGLNPHRIIRRGISFGEEVTDEEKQTQTTQQNRGLLFVCYQSSLANGFQFIQKSWANNSNFIFGKKQPPGFDPIIGQTADDAIRETSGLDPNDASGPALSLGIKEWVVSQGGEYFFSPSIQGLKTFAGVQ